MNVPQFALLSLSDYEKCLEMSESFTSEREISNSAWMVPILDNETLREPRLLELLPETLRAAVLRCTPPRAAVRRVPDAGVGQTNLRGWAAYNQRRADVQGLSRKKQTGPVEIDGVEYKSMAEAARVLDVSQSTIQRWLGRKGA